MDQSTQDAEYMQLAIEQAKIAESYDEVPIGAVVVYEGEVIAHGYNRRELDEDPAGHAEFIALKKASEKLGHWRLSGCTVYVTLEPCLMCAGLMYQSRIDRCVYGARVQGRRPRYAVPDQRRRAPQPPFRGDCGRAGR